MPAVSTITVPNGVTFITVSDSAGGFSDTEKQIRLPFISTSLGTESKIVYVKEVTGQTSNYFTVYPANSNNGVGGASTLTVNTLGCLQLQANGTNWEILDNYLGAVGITTIPVPGGTTQVNASANAPLVNVDLTVASKEVILPNPSAVTQLSNASMYYTIKDINGYASSKFLYVSADGGAKIDNADSILLSTNYASIQVLGSPIANKWFITGYYSGS